MALNYSKQDLENISVRLECCAVDAAKEAFTADMYLDTEKKNCAWGKYKFLQRASNILREYVPGGQYTYEGLYEIERINSIPFAGYVLKDAICVDDILSPYYGFCFALYQDVSGNSAIYVMKEGVPKTPITTSLYSNPYFISVNSLAYDSNTDNLIVGCNSFIQEYDLSPLLTPSYSGPPVPIGLTPVLAADNFDAAYNHVNNNVYFTQSAAADILKYDPTTNTVISIVLGASSSFIEANSSTGEVWVVIGNKIKIIDLFDTVTATLNLGALVSAVSIGRISYSYQLGKFIVPYFNGSLYKVGVFNSDGTVYIPSIWSSATVTSYGMYYHQDAEYFIGNDVSVEALVSQQSITDTLLLYTGILLNETKSNKIITCSNYFDPEVEDVDPYPIHVISRETETESLCLNDNDIQSVIETAQHHCCDCCQTTLDTNTLFTEPSEPGGGGNTGDRFTVYYGASDIAQAGKTDPTQITSLNSALRYQLAGTYNYTTLLTGSYLYFAYPTAQYTPTITFENAVTNAPILFNAPYTIYISGLLHTIHQSQSTYNTAISLKVST